MRRETQKARKDGTDRFLLGMFTGIGISLIVVVVAFFAAVAWGKPHYSEGCNSKACMARVCKTYTCRTRVLHKKYAREASSGWAIPTYIVMCESHGQNLKPNSAGASGYYQIIPSTWIAAGGQRFATEAYKAPKWAQDIVARTIYNNQSYYGGWDCA